MTKMLKVAIVGATGAVGETMLSILSERHFPVGELVALASERSAGTKVKFGHRDIVVQDLATFDPAGVDIALFSAGGATSKEGASSKIVGYQERGGRVPPLSLDAIIY